MPSASMSYVISNNKIISKHINRSNKLRLGTKRVDCLMNVNLTNTFV